MAAAVSSDETFLRAALDHAGLPYGDADLAELVEEYRSFRSFADDLLSVDNPLIVGDRPALVEGGEDSRRPERREAPQRDVGPDTSSDADVDTVAGAAAAIRRGAISCAELLERYLSRADDLDASLGCYLDRFDATARAAARATDTDLARGIDRGPLQGIPVGIKDNLTTVEGPTTAQSDALVDAPRVDSETVRRLRAAGATISGKLTLMEFATALPDPDQRFPTPRNPWDLRRWAGGSSSGAANGVAAGLFPAAIGTDTGGSIRNPAAFCGVTGFKPTYGLLPTSGMVPLAPSMDCIGPIARTAADCRLILSALAPEAARPRVRESLQGIVIGVDRAAMVDVEEAEAGVVAAFGGALDACRAAGARIVDVDVPDPARFRFVMRLLIDSERLALHLTNLRRRWHDYSPSFRSKVRRGVFGSAAEIAKAHQLRLQARTQVENLCRDIHCIASPTSHYTAPPIDGLAKANRPELQMTGLWSALGQPAVSVPMGFAANGMPLGLQLAGPWNADHDLLRIAELFQQQTDWHRQTAPLLAGIAP